MEQLKKLHIQKLSSKDMEDVKGGITIIVIKDKHLYFLGHKIF